MSNSFWMRRATASRIMSPERDDERSALISASGLKGEAVKKKILSPEERISRKNAFDASLVYGVRTFNLLTRRDRHINDRKKHDNDYTDPRTGFIYEHYAEYRRCPLCDAGEAEPMFVKAGFPYLKCAQCRLVYVNPILNRREYEKLWRMESSYEAVLESPAQVEMQTLEADYYLDVMEMHLADMTEERRPVIGDVGCGPGTLLTAAKKRGYQVFGIEPNTRCHKILEEKGIDYTADFFPFEKAAPGRMDCVFLMHTLEHLHNPVEAMLALRKLVKPGGLLYISVPNSDALVNRIMHEKAGAFAGHQHIQLFNADTLGRLFKKTGYEVLEHETVITEIGAVRNYLSFKDPYLGDEAEPLDFLTPELIYQNDLARSINMIGRLTTQSDENRHY